MTERNDTIVCFAPWRQRSAVVAALSTLAAATTIQIRPVSPDVSLVLGDDGTGVARIEVSCTPVKQET